MNPTAELEPQVTVAETEICEPTFVPKQARPPAPASAVRSDLSGVRYLRRDELPAWDALVDVSPQGSAFTRSWWLRAIGGEVRILAYLEEGRLLAGMPLYFEKRWGVKLCTMPKLTQTMGPVLAPPDPRTVNANWDEMNALNAFAEFLCKQAIFFQAFHPTIQNWCPFYWHGFRQTSRISYELVLDDLDRAFAGVSKSFRHAIRKAERSGLRVVPCDAETVWYAEQKTFARQNQKVPHSIEYLRRLVAAARQQGAGECLATVDEQGRVHAASFMIWDRKRAYALALGGDASIRSRGSTPLLEWHMIQLAAQHSKVYDFTGSMLQRIELFIRSFGGTQIHYNYVMKMPLGLRLYLTCRGKL